MFQKNSKGTSGLHRVLRDLFHGLECNGVGYICVQEVKTPQKNGKSYYFVVTTQVKKLQVMLRQANDQLEKTMKDKQELEDYMKQSAEDSSNQVQAFCNPDGRNHEMLFRST